MSCDAYVLLGMYLRDELLGNAFLDCSGNFYNACMPYKKEKEYEPLGINFKK